jgi:hypothetical protein
MVQTADIHVPTLPENDLHIKRCFKIRLFVLKLRGSKEAFGEMRERFKRQPWKGCVSERVPGVRISLSPHLQKQAARSGHFCCAERSKQTALLAREIRKAFRYRRGVIL